MSTCEVVLMVLGFIGFCALLGVILNAASARAEWRDDIEFRVKRLESWVSSQGSEHPQPPLQPLG